MILSGGDRYVGLVQLVALAFACVAIAGVARRLGFDRRARCLWSTRLFDLHGRDAPDAHGAQRPGRRIVLDRMRVLRARVGARRACARRARACARARHETHDGPRVARSGSGRLRESAAAPLGGDRAVRGGRHRRGLGLARGQPRRDRQVRRWRVARAGRQRLRSHPALFPRSPRDVQRRQQRSPRVTTLGRPGSRARPCRRGGSVPTATMAGRRSGWSRGRVRVRVASASGHVGTCRSACAQGRSGRDRARTESPGRGSPRASTSPRCTPPTASRSSSCS